MSNWVTVSNGGKEMLISNDKGQQATLRSARPGGFTATDVENARDFRLSSTMVQGQVNRARRLSVFGRSVYVHVNTGPPTWWWPRIEARRGSVMFGWFRVLIALSWRGVLPTGEQP